MRPDWRVIESESISRGRLGAATPGPKEVAQEGGRLVSQEAGYYFQAVIGFFHGETDDRTDGAGLGIVGSVDEAPDARLKDRPQAHSAWLDGHVEGAARQAVVAGLAGRPADGLDLGVGCRIIGRDRPVASPGQDLAVFHDDSADRDFALRGSLASLVQRQPHEMEIDFGLRFAHGK